MFERETDTIITTARQRIPHSITDSSTVMVTDILAADIPYALKTFFRADVEIMLAEELNRQRKGSRFNYDHPEVVSLQHQINSFLVMHYAFRRDEFHQRLDDAVHMIINYLVRPQWTLTNVLFETSETISTAALMRLLRYFGPYEYLRSLILRYIEDRRITAFTKQEFATLIWKVDGQFIRRKTGSEASKILTPLYEFIDFPELTGVNALPVKALVKYFSDKGLMAAARAVEDEGAVSNGFLHQRDLGDVLERVRRMSGAFEIEPRNAEQSTAQAEPEPESPEPIEKGLASEPAPPDETAIPKKSITFTFTTAPTEQPQQEEEPVIPQATEQQSTPPTANEPAPQTVQQAPRRQAGWPALLAKINESERRKFVKKIFKDSDKAFIEALRRIDELPTWRQASVFIDEILIENDIDPYSAEAIRFIDIVQEKYYPKR